MILIKSKGCVECETNNMNNKTFYFEELASCTTEKKF